MSIISIRGTSGSGKSTLVRQVMALYKERKPIYQTGRKQPVAYELTNGGTPLAVIGHYESPCGGCDTISSFDEVFALVDAYARSGYDVLFEGVLLYCEIPRTLALRARYPFLVVVALNTPLAVCVESINKRRKAKNPDAEPVNPTNTETKHKGTVTSMEKLKAAGVEVLWYDREQAFSFLCEELALEKPHHLLS